MPSRLTTFLVSATLLTNISLLRAQAPEINSDRLDFKDGLKLVLPSGWKSTVLEKDPAVYSAEPDRGQSRSIILLLHAQPEDTLRTASLSIVRDASEKVETDPDAKKKTQARLTEIAAERGFKVERLLHKGRTDSPNNIVLSEAHGVSGQDHRRTFYCLTVTREKRPAIRCYWQSDESDTAGRREFDEFISSMTCDEVAVADVLWSGATLAGGTTQTTSTTESSTSTPDYTVLGPTGPLSPEVADLVTKYRDSLIVVEGEKGRGSGFVCRMDGQPWLMTNIHVLADNPKPRFRMMNGKEVTLGSSVLGVDHDIFRGTVPEADQTLEVMTDLDVNVKIGDAIAVLGNPEGQGVIKPLEGKIVGIGPNLVEVDAPFVPGNSGSPIIHVASGKVVGIATYLMIKKVDNDKREGITTSIRRFGYRIDNVKTWEPVNWPVFYAQSEQAAKIEATGEEFIELFKNAGEEKIRSTDYQNPGINRALQNMERAYRGNARMSEADRSSVNRQLFSDLRVAATSDIAAFDTRRAYDFFRRQIAEEKELRDDICKFLQRRIEANR